MNSMKKISIILICFCLMGLLCPGTAAGETWEFGSGEEGNNPFTPRGYLIVTEDGVHWLNSRYDNRTDRVRYTSTLNGVDYIEAIKPDETAYTLYAFTDRNPRVYQYLTAYKNGQSIPGFSSYAGAPGRLNKGQNLGSGANWAIPITGFRFEPGCYYEFGFQRGMQANNGITLVLSEDRLGYIKDPTTPEEIAKYEQDKHREYQFISSYWRVDDAEGYHYEYNLVPMRFSVQTYADLSTWKNAVQPAQTFLEGLTPGAVDGVRYHKANIDNLTLLLEKQARQAERVVKKQLQPEAEQTMQQMTEELTYALRLAQSNQALKSDISRLTELLADARILYATAQANCGTAPGQYAANRVADLAKAITAAEVLTAQSPQAQINNAIDQLQQALVQAHNSVIRGKTVILRDAATGVSLIAPKGALPEKTILSVDTVRDNISQAGALETYFADNIEAIYYYQIKLYDGDQLVQPTESVEVQIPTDAATEGKAWAVYAADNGSQPVRLSSLNPAGYRFFRTDKVGLFALTLRGSTAERLPDREPSPGTAVIADQTSVDLNREPDRIKNELLEQEGQTEVPTAEELGLTRPKPDLLTKVHLPLDTLRLKTDPIYLLLAALGLVLLAFGAAWFERPGRRVFRWERR